tara:strand:+ start:5903 stop:6076 length:174 start_codon:yes stop_codon:yes gene_type:complete
MDVLKKKTDSELVNSLLAEASKARNELSCSEADIKKANGRMSFVIALLNELINRKKD